MPEPLPQRADVAIAGGGVIGLSLAFELLLRGRQVLVLERDRIGSGAAQAAAGMLAPVAEAEHEDQPLVEFALESHRLYPPFARAVEKLGGISCGYRTEGAIMAALTYDDLQDLKHLQAAQQARGLEARWLEAKEALTLEPALSPRVIGGLLATQDHQVDPRALTRSLDAAVRALGGRIAERTRVEAIAEIAGGAVVAGGDEARAFEVHANIAVLAAGAWSSQGISTPAGELAIRPVRGQVIRLTGPELIAHVVRTPACYLVPRAGGDLVIGSTMEEQGFDARPTAGAVMDLLVAAWRVLPALYDHALLEVTTGFRPATRDGLPILGRAGDSFFVATGHFRHGVLLAPATGYYLAEYITTGQEPPLLRPYRPERPSLAMARPAGPGVAAG